MSPVADSLQSLHASGRRFYITWGKDDDGQAGFLGRLYERDNRKRLAYQTNACATYADACDELEAVRLVEEADGWMDRIAAEAREMFANDLKGQVP
jgi:hypothetical protein